FKVHAGPGTTMANSGQGSDTFIGGSGTAYFQDAGHGGVTFAFDAGTDGETIIQGFDASPDVPDHVVLNGFAAVTQADVTVVGGSSYLDLGGTRLVFVGVVVTVTHGTIT
ncbi:MAG TPA: hypothetical protein VKS60_18240, partial [Stellaceae bacterium]|nr:hypothetical protein [Stellaceae bacterium]